MLRKQAEPHEGDVTTSADDEGGKKKTPKNAGAHLVFPVAAQKVLGHVRR